MPLTQGPGDIPSQPGLGRLESEGQGLDSLSATLGVGTFSESHRFFEP